ncbi:A/G-specific adenine glycosylase [Myxococcota bacterium]|nr:A/G-specific adenine glycosylase [Myxococcota bacterium]
MRHVSHAPDPILQAEIGRYIVAWYRAGHRDLPWRRTTDPYRIWLSEAMCQQTRVETAIPYYERFLALFPTVADLAAADLDSVLAAWAGLGYYSRARNLHAAASEVVRRHAGVFPDTVEALMALPGIGRYTAGAVASIAFGRPAPIVDGNVRRVLCRLFALEGDPSRPPLDGILWEVAAALVPTDAPGDFNQGLMELGARTCAPRSPACGACPVAARCGALRLGRVAEIPSARARPPAREVERVGLAVRDASGALLMARRAPRGLLGGLWELPGGDLEAGEAPPEAAARLAEGSLALAGGALEARGRVEHRFTHLRMVLWVLEAPAARGVAPSPFGGYDALAFLGPPARGAVALSALALRSLHLLGEPDGHERARRTGPP